MTFPIGELVGVLSLKGAGEFDSGIMGAQRSLNLAGESATRFAGSTDRAAVSSGKLRAAQLSAVAANERYNALLNDANASTARLASSEASLIRANERVAATAAQAGAALRASSAEAYTFAAATNRSLASSVAGVGKLALGLAGLAAVFKAAEMVKDANEFQQKMLLIHTNANAATAEVRDMTAAVLKLSPQVATGPNALADALYHVEQNGLRGDAALEALRVGAEGAKIGLADVEDTTNTMTIALASGIHGMSSMQKAMGTMIAIAGTGDMRLKDLNEALSGGILSVAKGYGATLGDVAAVLATLGDNGIRGADAATALRMTLMGFASPAAKGAAALDLVGLKMDSLAKDMERHGLVHAMNLLEQHMKAAGIEGSKTGAFITQAFGKRAGAGLAVLMGEIDRVNVKFAEGQKGAASFGEKWQATTKTTEFAMQRLGAQAEVVGIEIAQKATPAVAGLADLVATALPAGLHLAQSALDPFVAGWHTASGVIGPVVGVLDDAAGVLAPLAPLLKGTAGAALTMWVAFKGYRIAETAVFAIQDAVARMSANASAGFAGMGAEFNAVNAQLATQAAVMEAEFAAIGAAAEESAAVQAEAQLAAMRTYQEVSAEEIAMMEAVAVAARESAVVSATAAEEAAAAVAAAGAAARVGWASIAGPIALAALGVFTLVSMFHKSTTASKEATDAAKAYGDALKTAATIGDIRNTIIGQLTANDVPEHIDKLNSALGHTVLTSTQFVDAVQRGGKPLQDLKDRLNAAASASKFGSAQWGIAAKTLADLTDQSSAYSKAVQKDLADTKAFAGVSSSVDKVSASTKVASDTAKKYAAMVGIAVDQNGVAAVSSKTLSDAVNTVRDAYGNATATGRGFLDALATFSTSAGTAADRATLIGSTLKAANGDALAFAGSMAGAVSANRQLVDSFAQENASINDLRSQIRELSKKKKLSADDTRHLADLENQLSKAMGSTERAAINARKGTIDYNKSGAAPLISNLQAIQTAAMAAASATYEHNKSIEGGKKAADDAYKVYKSETSAALIDEATKLGLTKGQAKRLADQYFGMPKHVKTLIEAEGANPIVTVLNKIGKLLAGLTGQEWDMKVNVAYHTKGSLSSLPDVTLPKHHRAMGGPVTAGESYIVGEQRPEVFVPNVNGTILPRVPTATAGKTVRIDNLHLEFKYPEREKDTTALPRAARIAAEQIGSYL